CIGEKEVFAVAGIFDELMTAMERAGAVRLNASQIDALTKAAFAKDGDKLVLNKDLVGQDAAVLAAKAGMKIPTATELIFGETDEHNPFVDHEQMMPFVPFVRAANVDAAI